MWLVRRRLHEIIISCIISCIISWAAAAQTGCVPNPNINGPPFTNGCPIPASALNRFAFGPAVTSIGGIPTWGNATASQLNDGVLAYPGLNTSQDQGWIRSGGFTFSQEWGGQVGLNFNFTNALAVGIVTPAGTVTHACAGACFDAAIAGYAVGLNADRFAIGVYAEGNAEVTGGYGLGINSETSNCQLHVACGSQQGFNIGQIQAAEFDVNVISTHGNVAPTGVFFGALLDLNVIGPEPATLTALEISTIGGFWNLGVECLVGSVSTGTCINIGASSSANNSQSAFLTFNSINGSGTNVQSWAAMTSGQALEFNNTVNSANFEITAAATYPQFEMNFTDAGGNGGLEVGNTSGAANSISQVIIQTGTANFDLLLAASQAVSQGILETDNAVSGGLSIKTLAGPITATPFSGLFTIQGQVTINTAATAPAAGILAIGNATENGGTGGCPAAAAVCIGSFVGATKYAIPLYTF